MGIEHLKERLPEYARDLKLNLSSIAGEQALTEQQKWGAIVAAALAARDPEVTAELVAEGARHLSPEALVAAKTAAAIMAMNNIYYRFLHLSGNPDYRGMPARLRMNALAKPGVDKLDFELWSLTVSAVNGCGSCIDSHERALREGGMSREAIQTAVRIAAVIHAVAATLDGERALAGPQAMAAE